MKKKRFKFHIHNNGRSQINRWKQSANTDTQNHTDGTNDHAHSSIQEEGSGRGHHASHPVDDGAKDQTVDDLEEDDRDDLGQEECWSAIDSISILAQNNSSFLREKHNSQLQSRKKKEKE